MRLVTFNIRNGLAADGPYAWPLRRSRFLRLLKELESDIICLQEVLDFQLDEIRAALPGYDFVGVGRDDAQRAGEFVPIFFRGLELTSSGTMWLSETPTLPGSIAWGARLPRICTWAEFSGLTIANLHLDHESELARTRGVDLILNTLQADIVCGDFNAEPNEAGIRAMVSAGFADLGLDGGGTFNDFRTAEEDTPRIDYIFARPPLAGSAGVVRGPLVSDHWPVVADFAPCKLGE